VCRRGGFSAQQCPTATALIVSYVQVAGDRSRVCEWRHLASRCVSELYVSRRADRLLLADLPHPRLRQVGAQEGALLPGLHLRSVSACSRKSGLGAASSVGSTRCRLLLPMIAASVRWSVSLSRMHRITPALHSEADLRLSFTVWGLSVQPLQNYFGLSCFAVVASHELGLWTSRLLDTFFESFYNKRLS